MKCAVLSLSAMDPPSSTVSNLFLENITSLGSLLWPSKLLTPPPVMVSSLINTHRLQALCNKPPFSTPHTGILCRIFPCPLYIPWDDGRALSVLLTAKCLVKYLVPNNSEICSMTKWHDLHGAHVMSADPFRSWAQPTAFCQLHEKQYCHKPYNTVRQLLSLLFCHLAPILISCKQTRLLLVPLYAVRI